MMRNPFQGRSRLDESTAGSQGQVWGKRTVRASGAGGTAKQPVREGPRRWIGESDLSRRGNGPDGAETGRSKQVARDGSPGFVHWKREITK